MSMQCRILNSRSSTVSQYLSRRAEVECLAPLEDRLGRAVAGLGDGREGEEYVLCGDEVREIVQRPAHLLEGFRLDRGLRRDPLRARPQDARGQQIELGRLLHRLARVTPEERVRPRNQVIEVLPDDGLLVRRQAQPRDPMRLEGIRLPLGDLVFDLLLPGENLRVVARVRKQLHQLVGRLRRSHVAQRPHAPERFLRGLV
jgi:hypothetical protein